MQLFDELKRRNVFRVAGAYAVVGWLLIQVGVAVLPTFGAPPWVAKVYIALILAGFPIALVLAWAFEMTPEGVKLTANVPEGESIAPKTGRRLDYAILGGIALIAVMIVADRLTPEPFATPPSAAPQGEEKKPLHPEERAAGPRHEGQAEKGAPPAASIAVLPFADLSPAGDQEYFADGISEEILNVLAKIDGLKVASRTSSFAFKNQGDVGARMIAKELAVRHLLEGSVRKAGDTLRITAQLIDAEEDRHLWSETFDRPLTAENVFAVQDEIAGAIVAALGDVMDTAPTLVPVASATADLSAYDLYLEARGLYQARSQIDRVEALLAQAVERDPAFADAWALRAAAASLYMEYVRTDLSPKEIEARVDDYAARARALDPDNALAIAAPSNFRLTQTGRLSARYDIGEIIADLNKAVSLDPRDSSARNWLGLAYVQVGEMEKALETFAACAEFDPLFGPCAENHYDQLVGLGRLDEAWARFQGVAARGIMVDSWVNFTLLAHFDEKTAFMMAADRDWLPGWRRHDEIYEAFKNPGADHSDLVAAITDFIRDNPDINDQYLGALLIPIGAFDVRPYVTGLWAPDHARYRQSPQFHDYIVRTGIHDYWRKHGFPPQCKPVGKDDFECE